MDWPVLGRKRLLAQAVAPPEPPPKKQRSSRHCVRKLDLVLSRVELPEAVETLIENFVLGARYKLFYKKYGPQNARCMGHGFTYETRERWLWNVFAKRPQIYDNTVPALTLSMLRGLEGKRVTITYRNRQERITKYDKVVLSADTRRMRVADDERDPDAFTLYCDRLERLDLFVDLAKPGRPVPECLRDH